MTIRITLSAQNLGPDADEAFFDLWRAYVENHIGEALGLEVSEVEQFRFCDISPDRIEGATGEQARAIRMWLAYEGWESFCAEDTQWPA